MTQTTVSAGERSRLIEEISGEYDRNAAQLQSQGFTRQQFVNGRLIALGMDPTQLATAESDKAASAFLGAGHTRLPSREQVIAQAGRDWESNIAGCQSLGMSREAWIRGQLQMTGNDPSASLSAAEIGFYPSGASQMNHNPNAKFEAEFDATPGVYAEMGLSREQYVRSRRIDEGLEQFSMAPVAQANIKVNLADPANAKFSKEFDDNRGTYAEMGLSKEQYVRSRRVDEGLERLEMVGAR